MEATILYFCLFGSSPYYARFLARYEPEVGDTATQLR
jgi:hypothetical protein